VPTNHRRIPVTNDPELADALASVELHFPGAPAARLVHDLAIKGAQLVVREERARDEAIERLIAFSTGKDNLVDWDVLERVDELAWAE